MIQQFVDLSIYHHKHPGAPTFESFNIIKLFIAVLTIIFDVIFIFQHYVLYKQTQYKNEITQQLIRKHSDIKSADFSPQTSE